MEKKLIGRRINTARKDRGLTGEKLAEACNINATYLRQIESGTKIPSLPVFVTLCTELKVSPSYLLVDVLSEGVDQGEDVLYELLSKATPNQTRMIAAMVRASLDAMEV